MIKKNIRLETDALGDFCHGAITKKSFGIRCIFYLRGGVSLVFGWRVFFVAMSYLCLSKMILSWANCRIECENR